MAPSNASLAQAEAILSAVLAAVPQGGNPYQALDVALSRTMYLVQPASFIKETHILLGILALSLVPVILTLGVRLYKRQFWVFRNVRTAHGTYITPNAGVIWIMFGGWHYAALMISLITGLNFNKGSGTLVGTVAGKSCIYNPVGFGAWTAVWSMALASILEHAGVTGRAPVVPPHLTNCLFILGAACNWPITLVPFIRASTSWDAAARNFASISSLLRSAAASYNGTLDPNLVTAGTAAVATLLDQIDATLKQFVNGFIGWNAWIGLLLVVLLPSAFFHLRLIYRQLHGLQNHSRAATGPLPIHHDVDSFPANQKIPLSSGLDTLTPNGGAVGPQAQALQRQFVELALTSTAILLALGGPISASIWSSTSAREILGNASSMRIQTRLAIYEYTIFCNISMLVLLLRSFDSRAFFGAETNSGIIAKSLFRRRASLKGESNTFVDGITVNFQQHIEVELDQVREKEEGRGVRFENEYKLGMRRGSL